NAATATNINNGFTGVIGTNGASGNYKFLAAGTNIIQGLAQTIATAATNGYPWGPLYDAAGLATAKVPITNGTVRIFSTNTVFGTNNDIIFDIGQSLAASNSVIVGGSRNTNSGSSYSFLGGGFLNQMVADDSQGADYSVTGGGRENTNNSPYSFLGGGYHNSSDGGFSVQFLGGGLGNTIFVGAPGATLVSGESNTINAAVDSFLGSGNHNLIVGDNNDDGWGAVIDGGLYNTNNASGRAATISGGESNLVTGAHSWAGGLQSQATNDGAFV